MTDTFYIKKKRKKKGHNKWHRYVHIFKTTAFGRGIGNVKKTNKKKV